jgi:pilus assembly protein CpaC
MRFGAAAVLAVAAATASLVAAQGVIETATTSGGAAQAIGRPLSSAQPALAAVAAPVVPTPAPSAAAQSPQASQVGTPAIERVNLTAGRSTVLATEFDITRIAVTNPAVADAVVVQPRQILIDGKSAGTVSLLVWGAADRRQYDLVVDPGVSPLEQRLQALFPGEDIHVSVNDEATILSGRASSNAVALRAAEIARATSEKTKVVNLLQLPGGQQSQQVMLQVRFAEVTRTAALQLGASLFTSPLGVKNTLGRVTTQQFAAPGYDKLVYTKRDSSFGGDVTSASGEFTFSDFLNLFIFSEKYDLGAMIRALRSKGLLQSLAEPNLIAYNGQEASFLAGGEIPIPVIQGAGAGVGSVTVMWKEFGIRLSFTPTIAGDTVRLKVRPEVSALDFNNAVTISGFRIPALSTRRAETDVELRDGQSFAIAGLLDNTMQNNSAAVPLLSSIPILGYLFKSKAYEASKTELMVLITPRLVRPLDPDEVPALPTMPGFFLKPGDEIGGALQGGGGPMDAPQVKTNR